MSIKEFLSEKEKEELEIKLKKEIDNYKNGTICKPKFIYYLKNKCNFIEFCYLYNKYIYSKEKDKSNRVVLDETFLIEEEFLEKNNCYSSANKHKKYKINDIKRVKNIENMKVKGKKVKKRKK